MHIPLLVMVSKSHWNITIPWMPLFLYFSWFEFCPLCHTPFWPNNPTTTFFLSHGWLIANNQRLSHLAVKCTKPTILTDVNSSSSISSGGSGGGGPQTNGCPSPPTCVTSNVPLLGDSQPQTRSTSVKDPTITTSAASPIPHRP